MKNKFLQIVLLILLISSSKVYSQAWMMNLTESETQDFDAVQRSFEQYWEGKDDHKGTGWKQFKRWEHFWGQRLWPDGKFPNLNQKTQEILKNKNKIGDELQGLSSDWEEIGPVTRPQNQLSYMSSGIGRINCFEFHPQDEQTIWAGAAAGGAWKTTNGGQSWEVSDFTNFMSVGVSDITIPPSAPNVIYVATGDANGVSMTAGYSVGVIKSTDAGETWKVTALNKALKNNYIVSKILVNSEDENLIYASTTDGIYRSTDGGASWEHLLTGHYFQDMMFKPDDQNVIYASTSRVQGNVRIFKSSDAGETWKETHMVQYGNRIKLAVTEANSDYVYALISLRYANSFGGLYRSTDAGETWEAMSNSPNILSRDVQGQENSGQGHYDLALEASPFDENEIWTGGIHIWRSTNGGRDWTIKNHWTGSYGLPFVHADIHFLEYNRKSLALYCANDGGIYKTTNQGNSWIDLSDGIGIMQFYKISSSKQNSDYILGGSQDNGTNILKNGKWYHIYGGDGMANAIDPSDDRIFYVSTPYGTFNRTTNAGASFNTIIWGDAIGERGGWVTPLVIDPENPETIYLGYQNIYKSTNRGSNWSKISDFGHSPYVNFNVIALAPSNPEVIYAAVNNVLYRKYENSDWENIHTSKRVITDIAIDNRNASRVWITTSGYDDDGRVLEYDNGNILDLSTGIPSIPVNAIVHINDKNRELFVGTDAGVYYYDQKNKSWVLFNNNMPLLIVYDLVIDYASGKLRAGTYGRGIWESDIIDCDINQPTVKIQGKLEFCVGDTLTLSLVGDHYDYEWSTGDKSKSIKVTTSGEYYVRVYDEKGCAVNSQMFDVTVQEVKPPTIFASSEKYICEGESVNLFIFGTYEKYLWSTGATTKSIVVTEPGTYWAEVFNGECSEISEEIVLEMSGKPEKPSITVTAGGLKSTEEHEYQWYLDSNKIVGAKERYFLPDPDEAMEGEFQVEVINENGCSEFSETFYHKFTSVEDIALIQNEISIVPNPSDGVFDIVSKNFSTGKAEIMITSSDGIEIFKKVILLSGENSIPVDISSSPDGVYLINLNINNKNHTLKILKNAH